MLKIVFGFFSSGAMFFRQNPACTHRLVPWLTREFKVLLGPEHVQFMIQLVLSLLSKYIIYIVARQDSYSLNYNLEMLLKIDLNRAGPVQYAINISNI